MQTRFEEAGTQQRLFGENDEVLAPRVSKYQSQKCYIEPSLGDQLHDIVEGFKDQSQVPYGFMIGKEPQMIREPISHYRGDDRNFNEIFEKGFKSHGKDLNLYRTFCVNGDKTAFISTSLSKDIAFEFPFDVERYNKFTYVYEIKTTDAGIDVAKALRHKSDYNARSRYKEIAFPHKIDRSTIKGAWEIKVDWRTLEFAPRDVLFDDRKYTGKYLNNPNYVHPHAKEYHFWRGAKTLGYSLATIGVALDTASFYREYQLSQWTNCFHNTYMEGSRIIGGWTGALMAGTAFAEFGVSACAGFGPPVAVGCGVVSGLLGSGFGYYYGGEIGKDIYKNVTDKWHEIKFNYYTSYRFTHPAYKIDKSYSSLDQKIDEDAALASSDKIFAYLDKEIKEREFIDDYLHKETDVSKIPKIKPLSKNKFNFGLFAEKANSSSPASNNTQPPTIMRQQNQNQVLASEINATVGLLSYVSKPPQTTEDWANYSKLTASMPRGDQLIQKLQGLRNEVDNAQPLSLPNCRESTASCFAKPITAFFSNDAERKLNLNFSACSWQEEPLPPPQQHEGKYEESYSSNCTGSSGGNWSTYSCGWNMGSSGGKR